MLSPFPQSTLWEGGTVTHCPRTNSLICLFIRAASSFWLLFFLNLPPLFFVCDSVSPRSSRNVKLSFIFSLLFFLQVVIFARHSIARHVLGRSSGAKPWARATYFCSTKRICICALKLFIAQIVDGNSSRACTLECSCRFCNVEITIVIENKIQ